MAATFLKLCSFYILLVCIFTLLHFNSSQSSVQQYCKGHVGLTFIFHHQFASNLELTAWSVAKFRWTTFSSQPKSHRCCTKWHKHGHILIQIPMLDFPTDLTIHMDIEPNPGETVNPSTNTESPNCHSLQGSTLHYANFQSKPIVYTADQLLALKPCASIISLYTKTCLKSLGIARPRRGVRAGK